MLTRKKRLELEKIARLEAQTVLQNPNGNEATGQNNTKARRNYETEIQSAENNVADTSYANLTYSSSSQQEGTARRREHKRRIKWTRELNKAVMRIFYSVNECEDRLRPGYRHLFYNEFINRYPDFDITEQNLVDRRNVILKKRYLTSVELENIRRDVQSEFTQSQITDNAQSDTQNEEYTAEEQINLNLSEVNTNTIQNYESEIQSAENNMTSASYDNLINNSSSQRNRIVRRREHKRRIKWTRELNINVMRTFYNINECEDQPRPGYRHLFFNEFVNRYPDLNINEQNLVDRRNAILKKGYLTTVELENIRREVENELTQRQITDEFSTSTPENVPRKTEVQYDTQNEAVEEHLDGNLPDINANLSVSQKYYRLLEFYRYSDPNDWPKIPILKNIKEAEQHIYQINQVLSQSINSPMDINEIRLSIYCAATTVIELNGQKPYHQRTTNERFRKNDTPAWKWRLENCIDKLRAKIDIIKVFLDGIRTRKVILKIQKICHESNVNLNSINSSQKLIEIKDILRQKAKVKGARLRRYNELTKRKQQNMKFQNNRKEFFRKLEESENPVNINENNEIDSQKFSEYWKSIWSTAEEFNHKAKWIDDIENKNSDITTMSITSFSSEEVSNAIKKTSNWKAPGPDKIHNFWLKRFTATHTNLAIEFTNILNNPQQMPPHLTKGNTYLLHKKGDVDDPKNYRPITCLSVIYKLLTSLINNKIYEHCETNRLIEEEQKGCSRGALGCKQQLIIDAVILKQVHIRKRNIFAGYVDYSKAFDSIPHDWLVKTLEIYKICPKVINLLRYMMSMWSVQLHLRNKNISTIKIKRGIYQGDSLSPMWFCLALNSLSVLLKNTKIGYKLKMNDTHIINHLLYMDDLKIFAESRQKLESLLKTVKIFSDDIKMEFGLDKCAIIGIKKGVPQMNQQDIEGITELSMDNEYKYLGILQNSKIDHSQQKVDFTHKYKKRIIKILNTKLNGKNIITAINSWAVPVLIYSFGIIKWSDADLNELDRLTRSMLTKFRCLHTKSSVTRLYIPRKEGGRGLINIFNLCKRQEDRIKRKLVMNENDIMKLVVECDLGYTPLNLNNRESIITVENLEQQKLKWKNKSLHGKFPKLFNDNNIDKNASLRWLNDGYLYPETEGFILAIQDKVMRTKNYEKHILNLNVVDKCRICGSTGESIEHIMAGCSALASTAYLGRHNQLAKLVHRQLGIKYGLLPDNTPPYYNYIPEPVIEKSDFILYWDRPILTDRTVDYNRPDIIIINRREKFAVIIDIAVPLSHNIISTEIEKKTKYQNLAIQIKDIWKLKKINIIPLVISVEGVMSKKFSQNIKELGLPQNMINVGQKAVLLQTCHIIRKFLTFGTG